MTLYEIAVSMVFACGGGILAGAIVGSLPRPRVLIMPMISSLYAVPLVILYPVFTVWLGIGSESKIAFAAALRLPADHAVDRRRHPDHRSAAGAGGAQHGRDAEPAAHSRHHPGGDPDGSVGPSVGGALVIVGVVVSEMLISSAGIGYLISRYRTILDSAHVFAGVLLVLAMAIAFNAARVDRAQGRDLADRSRAGENNRCRHRAADSFQPAAT